MEKTGPIDLVFHEWAAIGKDICRRDIGWKDKWQYIFGPPGWSHDGSRMTSEQLRQAESTDPKSIDLAADPQF